MASPAKGQDSTAVHSMTGVGVARGVTELGELAVEARSVNGRNLQVGASGDLEVRVLGQPIGGEALLPDYLPGAELHLDLPALREE